MQVFSKIFQFLFPSHCLVCKQQGEYLCNSCKSHLLPHPSICPACHRATKEGEPCFSCEQQQKTLLSGTIIAFSYSKEIKRCIYAIKFYHKYAIAHFLAQRLALHIQSNPRINLSLQNTLITRVPNHRTRRRFQKGYNQSKILAVETAKILGIPAIELVSKIKKTQSQVSLSRTERLQNLLGAFQSKKNTTILPKEISHVIIIDDITTTGSTLEQVGKAILQENPNKELRGCVVARHN